MLAALLVFVVVSALVAGAGVYAHAPARNHGQPQDGAPPPRGIQARGRRRPAAGVLHPRGQGRSAAGVGQGVRRKRISARATDRAVGRRRRAEHHRPREHDDRARRVSGGAGVLQAAVRLAAGRGCRRHDAVALAQASSLLSPEAVRRTVSRGARSAVARDSRGACIPDRDGHVRG